MKKSIKREILNSVILDFGQPLPRTVYLNLREEIGRITEIIVAACQQLRSIL